ncbi:MAG: ABC transporter permease [Myxococcota bacterium]
MLRSYFLIALRNLRQNRLYTAITVFGLSAGLAATLLIIRYVQHELSYDRWIPDAERIALFHTRFEIPGREPLIANGAPGPAKAALRKDFKEIEAAARVFAERPILKRGDDAFHERVHSVDPEFFDVFDIPFLKGDRSTALRDTSSIVVSEQLAVKFFGDEDPIGQILHYDNNIKPRTLKVVGVIPNPPTNSSFKWNLINRFEESHYEERPWMAKEWTSVNSQLFVKMRRPESFDALDRALPDFERRNIPDMTVNGQEFPIHEFMNMSMIPLLKFHLVGVEGQDTPDYIWVVTFSVVAALILFIACINFMNLSTARASRRAREVALRKVMGASRRQLVMQFLGESILLALAGLFVGLAIAELTLPWFGQFLDRELALTYVGEDSVVPWMILLLFVVGVMGGLYPAIYLSAFRPASILKSNCSGDGSKGGWVRALLVTAQFAVSIALVVCTAVVFLQARFAVNKNLGFNKNGVVVVRGLSHKSVRSHVERLRQQALSVPGVTAAALSSDVPSDSSESNSLITIPGRPSAQPIVLGRLVVGPDFFSTYEIEVLAGRGFERGRARDDATNKKFDPSPEMSILVNQLALSKLGFVEPEEAVGQVVELTLTKDSTAKAEIIGVIDNFHYKSIRSPIRPSVYFNARDYFYDMSVRYSGVSGPEIVASLERHWKETVPDIPFRADYLDDLLAEQYERERRIAGLFGFFSVLAIVIACLGLYGLAAFTAARRTKEIGIRKVLGASVMDVVRLMLWQFSKPALLANAIAWPLAYVGMRWWLDGFEYRIGLSPTLFVTAGALALGIAWLTVGGHARRVARTHPAVALRYE